MELLQNCFATAAGVASGASGPPAADITRNFRLCPDPGLLGWASNVRADSDKAGKHWAGEKLVALEVAASSIVLPYCADEGRVRETCSYYTHNEKESGLGSLCVGCRLKSACVARYRYHPGGVALAQGHVAPCETPVFAMARSSFPGGEFDLRFCVGVYELLQCSLLQQ